MNRSYLLLCLVSLACGWDFYSIMPSIYYRTVMINQGLGNSTNIDDVEITDSTSAMYGWAVATFPIAAFIFSGVFGGLTPALGPKVAIVLGLLIMIAGNIIYMIDKSELVYVMAGRGVAGMGSGVRVACLAVVSSWYFGKMRGEKIGTWYMFQLVAMTIGPSVAAAMSSASFWDITSVAMPAFVSAILEFVTMVLILVFGLEPPPEAAMGGAPPPGNATGEDEEEEDASGHGIQEEKDEDDDLPPKPSSARLRRDSQALLQESDFDGLTQPLAVSSHYFHPDESVASATQSPRSPRPSSARLAMNPTEGEHLLATKSSQSILFSADSSKRETATDPVKHNNNNNDESNNNNNNNNGKIVTEEVEESEPPKPKWPPGLTVMLIANFVMICAVTTFEAMLTPLLHQRFSGSRLVANLTFAGIGLCVVIASVGAGVAQRCGARPVPVMILGVSLFLIGMILSIDYDVSDSAAMALETVAILLCSVGFTIAYVKTTEVYAGLIVMNGMLPRMGGLMALLSMLGSFGRVIGPLTTGYGLMVDENLIIYLMIGIIFFTLVLIASTKKHLELSF